MSGEIKLSQTRKGIIRGLLTAGSIGLILAGIIAPSHPIAMIWVIAASLLIYVIGPWICLRGRIRHRTPLAVAMGVIVLTACAFWNYAESRSGHNAQGQSAPTGSVDVQQNTSGAGSAAVNGNGNSVNTNVAPVPSEVKKGEKR